MTRISQAATRLGDLLVAPFGDHAAWALAVGAAVFGAVAIMLFKLATPQRRLAAARNRLVGRLLEAAIYQTSLRTLLAVQGDLLKANLRYLVLALPAIAALVLPLVLVLPQLESRFGRRPLEVGEAVLVTAQVTDAAAGWRLEAPAALEVEAGPVHDAARGELVWRVRALAPGRHELAITRGGDSQQLAVPVAAPGLPAIAAARYRNGLEQVLLDPSEAALPPAADVARFAAAMPARRFAVLGVTAPWLVGFTVLSLLAGLLLRKPLRVEL
ncbi:MAG: hypothetical protein R3D98_16880 [Candidatus Krumholzibacteriia bacterium]